MQSKVTENKRIAKNTFFLYVRMLLNMLVTLYTSRVVLNVLGVENYGIYSIVGGIITMFSFLNASMSGSTSRFITYELGLKSDKIQKIFSTSLTIHYIIAFIILILGETIGLWFFENKLLIPVNKMFEARWLYQLSILTAMLSITQVPYNSSIIANEKMNIYAYVEVLNVSLKLLIVYLLMILNTNKLILYGVLIASVTLVITLIYRLYCVKYLPGCKTKIILTGEFFRPMMLFSGWDMYGNISVVARTQGVNILLNMFFGAIINASSGIATNVQSAVMNFGSNIITAFRPQIIKQYALRDYSRVNSLINNAALYTYLLILLLSLPLIIEMETVLKLWLNLVPQYTIEFCRLTLIFNFMITFSSIIMIGIHATGHIKRPSFINGTLYLLVIPISYVAFKSNASPWIPYLINILAVGVGIVFNLATLHKYVAEISIKSFFLKTVLRGAIVTVIAFSAACFVSMQMKQGLIRFLLVIMVSSTIIIVLTYFFCLSKEDRGKINGYIKDKLKRIW